MNNMLSAESFRIRRGGAFPSIILVTIALNALSIYGNTTKIAYVNSVSAAQNSHETLNLIGLGFSGTLFAMIGGGLSVTRDFGNGSIRRSRLLAGTPLRLISIRAVAILPQLVAVAISSALSATVATATFLPGRGYKMQWSHEATTTTIGICVATVLAGYLGQFVAWNVRHSISIVILLTAWTVFIETAIINYFPRIGRLLPGGLVMSITNDPGAPSNAYSTATGYWGYFAWVALLMIAAIVRLKNTDTQ